MKKKEIITIKEDIEIAEGVVLEAGDRIQVLNENYYENEIYEVVGPTTLPDEVAMQIRGNGKSTKWLNLNKESVEAFMNTIGIFARDNW